MEAIVLLADWAEAINGKLYIQGGGWSRIGQGPLNCALAITLLIGWDETNVPHQVVIRLVDSEHQPVTSPEGEPVVFGTMIEVGRPPGMLHGSSLDATLAVGIAGVPMVPGRYSFLVEGDEQPLTSAVFDVI